MEKTKILVLGASGMLGHTLFKYLSSKDNLEVFGTFRDCNEDFFMHYEKKFLLNNIDASDLNSIEKNLLEIKPKIVINCIGVIKQSKDLEKSNMIFLNSLFPKSMSEICERLKIRLLLVSTDCVFSGKKGFYSELDVPDCNDLYGISKLEGEVTDKEHVITLRTSIIGHELRNKESLLEWFLRQKKSIKGYEKAIFSGFPTVVFAQIIYDFIIFNNKLSGLFHVSSNPISKFDLIKKISYKYKKNINIIKDDVVKIDRSLNSKKFKSITGFIPPSWDEMIELMFTNR